MAKSAASKQWQRAISAYRSLDSVKRQANVKFVEADQHFRAAKQAYLEALEQVAEVHSGLEAVQGLLREADVPPELGTHEQVGMALRHETSFVKDILTTMKAVGQVKAFAEHYKKDFPFKKVL